MNATLTGQDAGKSAGCYVNFRLLWNIEQGKWILTRRRKMLKKIYKIMILLFLMPALCHATPVDFYTDDTITGGVYDVVRTHNDATVDMTAGLIETYLELYDTSTFNAKGGTLDDGVDIRLFDSTTINFYRIETSVLNNRIEAVSTAEINIFGYGFNYVGDTLNGYWEDDTSFSLYIRNETTQSVITLHEVPEPTTCLLLGLGGLFLRKRN